MENIKKQLIAAEHALTEAERSLSLSRVRLARLRSGIGAPPRLSDVTDVLLHGVAICDAYERATAALRDAAEEHAATCPLCQVS